MAVELRVTGGAALRKVAVELRHEAAAKRRNVANAMARGARVLQRTIPAEAARRLPSGYGPTMARSVRVKTSVQLRRGGVTVRVYAIGRAKERDVARIDSGELRHPLWGRRQRWYATRVQPGFVTGPFSAAKPSIVREVDNALNAIVDRIERG